MTAGIGRRRFGAATLLLLCFFGIGGGSRAAHAEDAALLRGKHIVFVEPYGPGSVTNLPLALMSAEIERVTGASVEVKSMGGSAGGTALDYLMTASKADKGSLDFVVLDLTSRLIAEMVGGGPQLLQVVQPVALLSTGASAALVVSDRSPIKSIDDLLAQARSRQLRIVHLGRKAAFGLELAMLEKSFGLTFADKVVGTRAEGLAALASGEADAGFLVTYTLLPSPDAPSPPVRPILTFGAARNPGFPAVPTLKERSGNSGAAITTAIALFAPRDMPQATVAAVMEAMERVAAEPEIQKAAASHHFPLEVRPAAAVMAAMARSERLIKAHAEYLDR